ncbi:MAG: CHASE2 domain-containing protein [Candidatus Latescibacterota bacterium]|jgi:class 3 adenylate cyclase/CHASE2 domain-containing sensor protein
MATAQSKGTRLHLYLGPLAGLLIFLFSLTGLYERAELVSYDWRFHLRNGLFGTPPMAPALGTVEIDDQSVEAEGRYQDWTRDKYTEVVRLLGAYQARLVGFDVYFIEPSARTVSEPQLRALKTIDQESVDALLARSDHDARFRDAITAAGNVYLALYLGVASGQTTDGEKAAAVEPRSPDQEAALEAVRRRAPRLMVDPRTSPITHTRYFEVPLALLREAARGFAYAQTVTDVDGARRRYPLVYQYEETLFPSIALLMACDYLQVPVNTVEVWPGDHIRLPSARFPSGAVHDLEIPIDPRGNMNVNWAGRWEDTFVRYPHIALRRAWQREQRQARLEQIKAMVTGDTSLARDPRALPGALAARGLDDPAANRAALGTWFQAAAIESALRPDLTAQAFFQARGVKQPGEAQLEIFAQVARNNRVARLLEQRPGISAAELQTELPGETAQDLELSRQYVSRQMVDGRVPTSARPLFFYPYVGYNGRAITPEDMAGKVLFYGLTSTGSTDLSVTPFQGDYPMVGIYSNVLNTILNESFIVRLPWWVRGVMVVALGLLLSLAIPRLKVLRGALLIGVVVLVYAAAAFLAFTHLGVWMEMVGPLLILVVGYLALTIYGYVIKEKEKEFVQGAFGHYLSPVVVEQIMENPEMVQQLGGEERVMTAFFSDIAKFSTISECLGPVELVNFINQYLTEMCDIIERHGGTIDKFEGDAIVAFFGAPMYYEDHALRGIRACIDQQHQLVELRRRWEQEGALPPRLAALRERWRSEGQEFLHVRMGLTSGPMVVGNMGSRNRANYTMMGDTVNLAARFESGQKIYRTGIMINDALYAQVKDEVETRKLDVIQVVGKEDPVIAYEVLDRKGQLPPEKYQVLDLYNQGLAAYEAFQFAEAQRLFSLALELDPHDGPSALYADRCEDYAANPPRDLVFRAQSK